MNQIGEILKQRGIEDITPGIHILERLQIKLHTWNKWVHNKKDPEMWQIPILAEFLDCEIEELFPKAPNQSIAAKHGFQTA